MPARNLKPKLRSKNSNTGYAQIKKTADSGKFQVTVVKEGKNVHVGRFNSLKDALTARRAVLFTMGWKLSPDATCFVRK